MIYPIVGLGHPTLRKVAKPIDKDYPDLEQLIADSKAYSESHNLLMMPSYWNIFFHYQEDTAVRGISERLETLIKELHNSKSNVIIGLLNIERCIRNIII